MSGDRMPSTAVSTRSLSAARVADDGAVFIGDAAVGVERRLSATDAARLVLAGELPQANQAHPDFISWIRSGWQPALEYLLWSERGGSPHLAREPRRQTIRTQRPLGEILMERRTARVFASTTVVAEHLTDLFAVAESVGDDGLSTRAVVYAVDGRSPGVWRRDQGRDSALECIAAVDLRTDMSRLMCGMPAALTAAFTLVFVLEAPRRQVLYPYERALREVYIEVARRSQHVIVAAEDRGLGCLITPATNDRDLTRILNLSRDEYPVYTVTVGVRRSR